MDLSDLQLREYRRSDLDAMFRLDEICFEPPFRFSRAAMRHFAQAPNAHVVIGEAHGKLAGFCIFELSQDESEKTAYVVTLDVDPGWRRLGVAKVLMQESERAAAQAGCGSVILHVFTGNAAAIRFYEREGFQLIDQAKGFYGKGIDALVFRKTLRELKARQIAQWSR